MQTVKFHIFRIFMARAAVALLAGLMTFAPLAGPMTAAATGRVFEEIVEEEVKFIHQSSTQVRRGRQKRQPPRRQPWLPQIGCQAAAVFEPSVRPHCFWFSPPPLLRAPPVRV